MLSFFSPNGRSRADLPAGLSAHLRVCTKGHSAGTRKLSLLASVTIFLFLSRELNSGFSR